jgi:hypothetical protein
MYVPDLIRCRSWTITQAELIKIDHLPLIRPYILPAARYRLRYQYLPKATMLCQT